MSDFQIFTDSTIDLTADLVKELGVEVMGLYFHYNGTVYRENMEHSQVSMHEFYDYLRNGGASSTSQVNIVDAKTAFEGALKQGKDILCLAFSSGLSGTYHSCCMAAEELREQYPQRRIEVFDTLNASLGEGLMVYYAAKMQQKGKTMDEILTFMKENIMNFNAWFTVDDLMFLKRGGRLGGGVAIVGTLLGIKPLLHIDEEGHLINMAKVRGRKTSIDALVKQYKEHVTDPSVVMISHGDCPEDAEYLAAQLKKAGAKKIYISYVGTVIGGHSGPGTLALFYFGNGR